jgi:hypothetical protein
VGQDQTLFLTLPEKCADTESLREAVLDHYRYQHYLVLYRRHVAPLERSSTTVTPEGHMVKSPEIAAAVEAAEARISRQADAFRARLEKELELGQHQHFLAPYRHGMGTLYQAAFGRCQRSDEKQLHFAIGTVEASTRATEALELPAMGKLSYLRALLPVASRRGQLKTLPLDHGEDALAAAYGNLERKNLVRDLRVIRLGTAFTQHISAVLWRPYWITEVTAPKINDTLLVDAATGSVVGAAPYLNPEILEELPQETTELDHGLRFLPMQCPTCGHEFPFDADAVLHFCTNCHRVCGVEQGDKREVQYGHVPPPEEGGHDLVPFWFYKLRLRTGDGQVLTDLLHLKDGIDGTLDQIGDEAPVHQHAILIPAIRCINSRLMAQAFNRLFIHTLRSQPRPRSERLPLDLKLQPWEVGLGEREARSFAPLFLANVFGHRDLAKVNVHQVAAWLFEGRMESSGTLAYIPVPLEVTRPFRDYLGRFRGEALDRAKRG